MKKKNLQKTHSVNVLTIIGLITAMTFLFACASENKIVLGKFISGKTKVLVCPVHILDNQKSLYDTISSKKIVDYINGKKYAFASVTQLCPPANNEWRGNEAKILTISINLFIEFVKKNNLPEDTYILYPEFLKAGQNSTVIAVHYCLLNNKGEIAMRGLLNSHWDEFKKVNPKTNNDCVDVFINGFEEKMKK
ncbi:MAG: hypothetical protein NTX93_01065 [Bacteroidia bacterium]|nr:hypothetical protein [Bacteroidia bacterium]